jgi:hypothetical protein
MPFVRRPDPATLVTFYRRVRPLGWWGPVAALAPEVVRVRELPAMLAGVLGGLACVWGAMIGAGLWLLERNAEAGLALVAAAAGTVAVWWAMGKLSRDAELGEAGEGGAAGG